MDTVSLVTNFQNARAALMPQLNSLLGGFGVTLPALNAQGNVTQAQMNSIYAAAAAAFPAVWVPANVTLINALLTQMGLLATAIMPLVIIGTANASGANGATVSTTVTLPNALPNTSYAVFVDSGQAGTWFVTTKTTTTFVVSLVPPSAGTAIAASTFNALITN
jgi:hypothetical protein